jgi:hypothetical protein
MCCSFHFQRIIEKCNMAVGKSPRALLKVPICGGEIYFMNAARASGI